MSYIIIIDTTGNRTIPRRIMNIYMTSVTDNIDSYDTNCDDSNDLFEINVWCVLVDQINQSLCT